MQRAVGSWRRPFARTSDPSSSATSTVTQPAQGQKEGLAGIIARLESRGHSSIPPKEKLHAAMKTGQSWRLKLRQGLRIVLALVVLALAAFTWAWQATPSVNDLGSWVRRNDAAMHASYTPIADISPWMPRALVAIEDERFYTHHGIDTIGLMRAAWDDLRAGHIVEGGSTLTAQLAKNAYLQGNDHTFSRKLQDLLLALKIESQYTKSQILEYYLNLVYFGEGSYGIGAATTRYFGVHVSHLDLAQAALLAGLVQAPGYYDPWCHPGAAQARQHDVLDHMVEEGMISPAQAQAAERERFAFWAPGAKLPADAYCAA